MSKKVFRNFSLILITLITLTLISSNTALAGYVTPDHALLPPAGGAFWVNVTATGDWFVTSSNYAIATPGSGAGHGNSSFVVYVSQNISPNPRGAIITVTGDYGPGAKVYVDQYGTVYCGNGACDGTENFQTCNADCDPYCGDDICSSGENCQNCGTDCGACPSCAEQCTDSYNNSMQDLMNIYASCGENTSCHLYVYQMFLQIEDMYDYCLSQCQ